MRTTTRWMFTAAQAVGLFASAWGGMVEWSGEGGDRFWSTPANWKGGQVPGTSDTAVFDPGEGKSISVDFSNHGDIASSLRFLSGTTTFGSGMYVYLGSAPTNEVYVAAGATMVCSNVFQFTGNGIFAKTGGGLALFTKTLQWERFDKLTDIREGTLQIGANYNQSPAAYIGTTNIVIRSGARLALYGSNVFNHYNGSDAGKAVIGAACLNIEKGGTVYYEGYKDATATFSSINGEGNFEMGGLYNTWQNSRLTCRNGPSRFAGKFVNVQGDGGTIVVTNLYAVPESRVAFVVGATDTLADLKRLDANKYIRFASGVGAFDAKEVRVLADETLTLADEAGKPVTLTADVTMLSNAQIAGRGRIVAPTSLSLGAADGSVACREAITPKLKLTADNAQVTLLAGRYHAAGTDTMDEGDFRPAGMTLGYSSESNLKTGSLTVSAGADLTLSSDKGIGELTVSGGTLRMPKSYCGASGATAAVPSPLKLDGGTIVANYKSANLRLLASDGKAVLGVGARGGLLTVDGFYDAYNYDCVYLDGVRAFVDGGTDGGMTLDGCVPWYVTKPFVFDGTSRIRGTLALIYSASELAGTPAFFGAGDIELDSCALGYHKSIFPQATGQTCTLRLATAEGKKLTANGGPMIMLQGTGHSESRHSSLVPQNVEIGELAFKPGALLTLSDYSGLLGTPGNSSVKVLRNAPAVSPTSGRVLAPVLMTTGFLPTLLSYDTEAGFCAVRDTVSDFEGAAGKIVSRGGQEDATLPGDTAFAADGVILGDWCDVYFDDGASLTVGDGTNPAIIAMAGSGGLRANGNKTGSLEFGEAPGYIVIGAVRSTSGRAYLGVPIRSAKTMTFASYPDCSQAYHWMEIPVANTYAGDTYVNDVILYAKNTGCFSTGTVHVAGGQFAGGNIVFNATGTWANDFELSGWGLFASMYGSNMRRGAFSFQADDSVIAGKVELKGDVRFSSTENAKGTVTGVVSGDRLRIINSLGTIVLANGNTYTGGTEVIKSTLTLKKGTSAGTGAVLLDQGILRFENDEPVTFANEVWFVGSTGRVIVAGAPVTFTGPGFESLPFKTLAAGSTIDLADPSKSELVPHFTADTDLGGRTYAVAGVSGTGRISNGTLTVSGEISPAGEGACGTLEFAGGVLVSNGATYVCDVMPEGEDRLVVGGAFSLSALNFRMVAPDPLGSFRRTVMTSGGSFSGSFASISTPRRSYLVTCGAADVTVGTSGLTIIVR